MTWGSMGETRLALWLFRSEEREPGGLKDTFVELYRYAIAPFTPPLLGVGEDEGGNSMGLILEARSPPLSSAQSSFSGLFFAWLYTGLETGMEPANGDGEKCLVRQAGLEYHVQVMI